jgi:2-(1,2-epoxy-1,2-dihydrophenyl)acetyl-CoA isomerase
LIYKSVSDENFEQEVNTFALKLAKMPTKGLGLTKRALNASFSNDLTSQLAVEEELQTQAGATNDFNEGVQAFLAKRTPNFKGN